MAFSGSMECALSDTVLLRELLLLCLVAVMGVVAVGLVGEGGGQAW